MIPLLRRLLAIAAVVGLLAPATAAVCLQAAAGHCAQPRSEHDCCTGPRLTPCNCGMTHAATFASEPAQKKSAPGPDVAAADAVADLAPVVRINSVRSTSPDRSPPPLGTGDRLSLLSILVV